MMPPRRPLPLRLLLATIAGAAAPRIALAQPGIFPTDSPVELPPPQQDPTEVPTAAPATEIPTAAPATEIPTAAPVVNVTTDVPTASPVINVTTDAPTAAPVINVTTEIPTAAPVLNETNATEIPTAAPVINITNTSAPTASPVPAGFSLRSSAFAENGDIPIEHTCDGEDYSFPLTWSNPPSGTASFVLLVQDPDAIPGSSPPTPWNHWVIYNIPNTMSSLEADVPNQREYMGAIQGYNSWRTDANDTSSNGIGYGGMCPNPGDYTQHTYPITLYALSVTLDESLNTYDEVVSAMEGNILGESILTANYQREVPPFSLSSTSFGEGGNIPVVHTCDGADTSFPLSWSNPPAGTASYALLIQDPDAIPGQSPPQPWTHWVMFNIPTSMSELEANVPNEREYMGALQGYNSWRTEANDTTSNGIGYGGMCPNEGDYTQHSYPITLLALSTTLADSLQTYDEVLNAAQGDILETAILNANYQRRAPQDFALQSTVVNEGGNIPVRYTCDGRDISPPLNWVRPPQGTESFALLLQDPDAIEGANPPQPWTHWVMYDIPSSFTNLASSIPNQPNYGDARQGPNSWRTSEGDTSPNGIGYGGMCPLPGDDRTHTYPLTLYALSDTIDRDMLTYDEVLNEMEGMIIESTVLTFYYRRGQDGPPTPAPAPEATDPPSGGGRVGGAVATMAAILAGWMLVIQ